MMNSNTLHRFFKGLASVEEKEAIRQWLESDPRHGDELLRERAFFNATLFSPPPADLAAHNTPPRKPRLRHIAREAVKIAAVAALTLSLAHPFRAREMQAAAEARYTVSVPPGQQARILLADGTRVWLNARSELTCPALFSSKERRVELKGEAYFEVSRAQAPFTVHTEECDVEALGTAFNVSAYGGSETFSVALIKGAVKVSSHANPDGALVLAPSHRADCRQGALRVSPIDSYDTYRWREGLLCFRNMPFSELLRRLEQCFDTHIILLNGSLANHTLSGKLRISDGIDNALRILQKEAKYSFTRNTESGLIYIE
jgi:ferric-dicitrate binding protein FerR (iron transport regulator)